MSTADLMNLMVSHLRASSTIKRFVNNNIQQNLDLSFSELIVLLSAIAKPGLSQQDIAQSVHQSHAAISRQMAGLQDRGYLIIQPDPQDRRRTCISASQQGRELTKKALQQVNEQLANSLAPLELAQISDQVRFNHALADLLDDGRYTQTNDQQIVLYEVWQKLSLEDE